MKFILLIVMGVSVLSCGGKSKSSSSTQEEELNLGIMAKAECKRSEEVRGTNSLYKWIKAEPGNLQQIMVDLKSKSIEYDEATTDGPIHGKVPFVQKQGALFFKTASKSLKLKFPPAKTGMIENDLLGKEYVVSVLSYEDGSGFQNPFLCPKEE